MVETSHPDRNTEIDIGKLVAEFEAAAKRWDGSPYPLWKMSINGKFSHYTDPDTDNAWIGFCWASEAKAASLARVEEKLEVECGNHRAAIRQLVDIQVQMADPNAVHVNLLRGSLAKPSEDQILHIYPELARATALESQLASAREDAYEDAAKACEADVPAGMSPVGAPGTAFAKLIRRRARSALRSLGPAPVVAGDGV